MATYQAPFQREAITEVVPRALELSSLSKSSLLTGRRRIRVIPQTGQTYGASSGTQLGQGLPTLANILLQDSAGLLDMQSVVLSMNVKVATKTSNPAANAIAKTTAGYVDVSVNPYAASLGASAGVIDASSNAALTNVGAALPVAVGGGQTFDVIDLNDNDPLVTAVLDDFAWSVFRRIQISLNSQLVDDLDYCGRRATTEVYQSASPSWYDTIGTVMGAWKLTQGEFVQPLIVAPASSTAAGGGTVAVASFPIKSRVQAGQWAAYSQQLGIQNTYAQRAANALGLQFAAGVPSPPLIAPGTNGALIPGLPGQPDGVYTLQFTSTDAWAPDFNVECTLSGGVWISGGIEIPADSGTGSVVVGINNGAALPPVAWGSPNAGPAIPSGALFIRHNFSSGNTSYGYLGNIVYYAPGSVAPPLVAPTICLGNSYTAATQPGWLDGGVGALQKLGHSYQAPGPYRGSPLAVRPLCLAPDYTATITRTDVLSKLYATSKFMKDVFFSRYLPTAAPGACQSPPLLAGGLLENVYLNQAANAEWAALDSSEGAKFSVPMGLLSHLFRQEQLFPLRNAGQLIIQIQFADALECCYAGFLYPRGHAASGAGVADLAKFEPVYQNVAVGYQVTNLELECDIVTAIPEYTAILDAICSRPADKGLAIAFDSHLSSLQQVSTEASLAYGQASGNGSTQSFTLIASKGSENVRSFTWTFSPTAGLRSQFYMQNSTFPAYNMNQWQIRVGSVYYPAFPSKGLSKNYMEMLSAINAPMPSIGQATLINYNMYRSSTPSNQWFLPPSMPGAYSPQTVLPDSGTLSAIETWRYDPKAGVFSAIRNATSEAGMLLQDPATSFMSDAFIGSYCFDNLKHAEPLSHDGIDTRAIAGGMIQLDFTCEPLENFAVIFHIRFTRTIVLAENGVSIVG